MHLLENFEFSVRVYEEGTSVQLIKEQMETEKDKVSRVEVNRRGNNYNQFFKFVINVCIFSVVNVNPES